MSSWWSVRKTAIKKTQTYFPVNESNDQAQAVHGNVSDNQGQHNGSSSAVVPNLLYSVAPDQCVVISIAPISACQPFRFNYN